jgi:hypothetical protein
LDTVIATGMAKDPAERYGTTTELARAARSALTAVIPKPPADTAHTAMGVAPSFPTEVLRPEHADEAWARTQARTPEYVEKAWAPTQNRPVEDLHELPPPEIRTPDHWPEGTAPSWPWWRRTAVVIPAAVLVVIAAVATIIVVVSGGEDTPSQTGTLNGTYTVEFASATRPNGQPYDNAPGGRETWVIKSACPTSGCMATASRVDGSQSTASTMVLDEADGRWTAVSATQGTCQNAPSEFWEEMSLQRQPDGKLQGQLIVRSTSNCARNQQVTFTRTGDVQGNVALADPAAQSPRVQSPAQALHGRYQETDTYADGGRTAEVNFDIQTYCLRTGDRCLSYWLNPDDTKVLVFSQNRWVLANTSVDATCKNGSRARGEVTLQYPLPQPPQNPITLLSGRGHYTVVGECPFNSDFDSRVQRTGD